MPRKTFEADVRVDDPVDAQLAIAAASRYLTYADQTDTFGYHGEVKDVLTTLEDEGWTIRFTFEVMLGPKDEERFRNEVDRLSRAELVPMHESEL